MDLLHAIRIATTVRNELPALIQPSASDYAIVRLLEELERLRAELAVARSELAVSVGHLSRLAEAYGCDDFTSAIDAALAAKGGE